MLDQKHFPFDHHVIGVENDPFLIGRLLLITEGTRRVSVCLSAISEDERNDNISKSI